MWQKFKNIYHAVVAISAAVYFGLPGKRLKVIAVTGTDGKTTTTHLIYHILKLAGKKVAMVSSVHAEVGGNNYDTGFHVTTPDPWMLQKLLRKAVDRGEEYIVLEVTSHGIDQNRILGIDIDIAALTNVTPEHLDYHHNYQSYVKTKEKLLLWAKIAVINKDDESFHYINSSNYRKLVTYGFTDADVTPDTFHFSTSLPGRYNCYNCLAAIAVTRILGISDTSIRRALKSFTGVQGRFEFIENGMGFTVIIDFAHTQHAIEQVLSTIKPTVEGKLIHVFGSAGLRDKTKRPVMGELSAKYADVIILTEEDFRTEDVHKIIDDIAQGCLERGATEYSSGDYRKSAELNTPALFRVPDRKKAIEFAIQKIANPRDTIILTGKAHEKSLCRGKVEYPWSEYDAVRSALGK